uniref:Odorant binding protein n=1 Tax=Hippodamia variegata TaxID=703264 RepID=A0A9E9NIW1_9CUCU|nr:odorant binding protein [Hippodamia variegata]
MLKGLIFLCLVAIAVAKEPSPCEGKHNVDQNDWKTLNADTSKPSEKMLCFFKCIYEENGSTNSDGSINVEKMIENTHKWKPLTDDSKASIRECAKELGPVKTCADVNPSFQCIQKALKKQGTA